MGMRSGRASRVSARAQSAARLTALLAGGLDGRRVTIHVSPAKERTLRRLLRELVNLGEPTNRDDLVAVALQLRSVLREIGHDV